MNKSIKCKSQLSFSEFAWTDDISQYFHTKGLHFKQDFSVHVFECTLSRAACAVSSAQLLRLVSRTIKWPHVNWTHQPAPRARFRASLSRSWCWRLWQPCKVSLTEAVSFCLGHSSSEAGAGRDLAKRERERKKLVRKEKHRKQTRRTLKPMGIYAVEIQQIRTLGTMKHTAKQAAKCLHIFTYKVH